MLHLHDMMPTYFGNKLGQQNNLFTEQEFASL